MTVYNCVTIYDGNVDEMYSIRNRSDAYDWFMDRVEANGGKEACEEGDYNKDGDWWHFYNSVTGGNYEIVVKKVPVLDYEE